MILSGLFALISSLFINLQLLPFTIKFGEKKGILDIHEPNKQKSIPKVRIGGISIFISYLISALLGLFILTLNFNINTQILLILFLFIPSIFLLGLLDDIYKLSPLIRLIFQFLISFFTCKFGLLINIKQISLFQFISGSDSFFVFWSYVITMLWITGLINAFNWLDGLDGLAAGFASISSFVLIIISFQISNPLALIISTLILGTSSSFLIYNFYPSKILMGDSGSNFLGFSLAIASLLVFSNQEIFYFERILMLFLVPLLDMGFVIFSRLISLQSPFQGDRRHFHYRLLNVGISYKKTIFIMYFLFILTGILCLNVY